MMFFSGAIDKRRFMLYDEIEIYENVINKRRMCVIWNSRRTM